MSLQDRMRNRKKNDFLKKNLRGQFFRKNRRGVSIMVGYVLLVVFAVILSVVTYNWIRTYVPAESLQCPDGVSVFVKITDYNCSTNQFNITVKNNGRFDILGYFIHAANESTQEIATIDLSQYLNGDFGGQRFGSSVAFVSAQDNSFSPGQEKKNVFDLPLEIGRIMLIQIIPTRLQEQDNKKRFISCGDSKIKQTIVCGVTTGVPACTPDCGGRVCGLDPVCGTICPPGCDPSIEFCDGSGQCISTSCNPATDPTLSGICGTRVCGILTNSNGTCGDVSCGSCDTAAGEICDAGQCTTIGNGQCDAGETCAEEPEACEGQQAQCQIGEVCQSGSCVNNLPSGPVGCNSYCNLFDGYTSGFCTQNENKCDDDDPLGVYVGNVTGANATFGDSFCNLGNTPTCCCLP